jgi:hypothetical protein
MIPEQLQRSVKELLDRVEQNLSNNGCNDWDFSPAELKAARKFLGYPDAQNLDHTVLAIIRKALGL